MSIQKAKLYVVATPIGNLADLSARAQETLAAVDVIAAEDTRHTGHLLDHYGIKTTLTALHEHNEREAYTELLARLRSGNTVALVSDAGTPLLNDPGFLLVRECRRLGISVTAIPGPSAITAALSIGGVPTGRFAFEGFLPAKTTARKNRLRELMNDERTLIFFEVPHRVVDALEDITAVFGRDRQMVLARELTKIHEQVIFGTASQVQDEMSSAADKPRGEMVLLIHGAAPIDAADVEIRRVLQLLLGEMPLKRAAELTAKITGCGRNRAYEIGLTLQSSSDSASK